MEAKLGLQCLCGWPAGGSWDSCLLCRRPSRQKNSIDPSMAQPQKPGSFARHISIYLPYVHPSQLLLFLTHPGNQGKQEAALGDPRLPTLGTSIKASGSHSHPH